MEEFDNSPRTRRPRQYTYRGSYRRPGSIPGGFNPAADVLSAIEEVEGKFVKRRKDIDLFEQQAMQRRLNLQKMVDDTKTMDENPFKAQMTQEFSQMVDDLYRADIESFDGDRTGYMEKANNAQKAIGDFQKVVGLLDADVNEYKDKSPAELKKLVLRSQFMGKDGMKREDYLAFLNDPGKMGMRIQNGELIITNNGKDLFNGTRYLNSKKEGYSLVEYADDYEKELTQVSNEAATGLQSLVEASSIEKAVAGGTKVTKEVKNDYIKAVDAFKNNLQNSSKIDALINESTFQRFVDSPDVYSEEKYGKQTKQKIVDYLVSKKFPMYDKVAGTAFGDVKTTTDIGAPMSLGERARLNFQKQKFNIEQIQTAKTEQELQRSIDFYLNRNLEHAAKVSKMPKNSKQRADETVKLLNEARGIDELGFKTAQGIINESGEFEENSESGKYYILDADNALVQGVGDNIGLVDALNQETVYKNLKMETRSEIKPYVTNRMANFSKQINAIENKQPVEVIEKVKGEDTTIPTDFNELNKYVDNTLKTKLKNINLQEYNKYRKKQGLEEVTQSDFDNKYKPTLINDATEIVVGGTAKDNISLIIYNEIDDYARKNKGKKSNPKSILWLLKEIQKNF